jgi:hypothetical protein
MAKITVINSNSRGMVRDTPDQILPLEFWTTVRGARVTNGKISRIGGSTSIGLADVTGVLQIEAFRPYNSPGALLLLKTDSIWHTDGSNATDVSRLVGGAYTAIANGWTYTNLNGLPILTNPADKPQVATSFPISNFVDLPNWPATWLADGLRSFKNFLIALNLVISGTEYPYQLGWSNVADAGTVPADWSTGSAASLAGLLALTEFEGPIIDALPLRDLFVIYKDYQAFVLTLGGNNVFQSRATFPKGLMAKNCVVLVPIEGGRHFCVGRDDIYLSNGNAEQSLVDERLRDWFFDQLTDENKRLVNCRHHPEKKEVWIFYPSSAGLTVNDTALIWNYTGWPNKDAWYIHNITSNPVVIPAIFNIASDVDDSWAVDEEAWEDDEDRWISASQDFAKRKLVGLDTAGDLVYIDDSAPSLTATIERTGLAIAGKDYKGQLVMDPDVMKQINAVWPRFTGVGDCNLYVGAQEHTSQDSVVWNGPYAFTIGEDFRVPCYARGRLLAIRFELTDANAATFVGYDLELEAAGS